MTVNDESMDARIRAERLLEAQAMVRCPYYQHDGTCDSGCYCEPACVTDAPREGWEALIASLRAERAET